MPIRSYRSALVRSSRTHRTFLPILDLGFLHRLPLHVARRIGATGTERRNVVHNVPRSSPRITSAPHEFAARTPATLRSDGGARCRAGPRTCGRCAIGSRAGCPPGAGRGIRSWLTRGCVAPGCRRRSHVTPAAWSRPRMWLDIGSIPSCVSTNMDSALCVELSSDTGEGKDREEQPLDESHWHPLQVP